MLVPRSRRRARLAALVSIALTTTGLLLAPQAAQADVSASISSYPYNQDWSDAGLITTNNDWSGVAGVQGYRGDDLTAATGTDPQTIVADGSATPINVTANQATTLDSVTAGGIYESELNQSIAFQGSGTADAPVVVFHLDLTGKSGAAFAFDAKDLDGSADNAIQPVAVQYRVGSSGDYTNLPSGFIDDATTGPSLATLVTHRDVALPASTDGEADVFVRVMTANAIGSDEWVGIDNIAVTADSGVPTPVALAAITDKDGVVGTPITSFSLVGSDGTPPYTYSATGLPTGVSVDATTGEVTGTPTATCVCAVTAKVEDSAAGQATKNFTFTVTAPVEPATRTIQILGSNDFHGRLQRDSGGPTAGAAVMAGAVEQLRAANPDTVFAMAGDIIGASTFESFIQHDKPTIDAMNAAGLEVSSVGNHEFDQGLDDLVNRVMQPESGANPEGGANWQYLAANITNKSDNSHPIAPSWTKEFGSVKVGFIGAVTEELPSLVSPAGIATIDVKPIVSSVNTEADALKAGGADIVVMLVHEGAAGTDCSTMLTDPKSAVMAGIINGVNDNVDAIISGHTHLSYNCHFPVPGWSGRPVTDRPVVSAGQYGMQLDKLIFTVDTASNTVTDVDQSTVNLQHCTNCPTTGSQTWVADFPADPAVATIVSDAVTQAGPLGAVQLGQVSGEFHRGKLTTGSENRGAESTLGNLVAEVQKWATRTPETGASQIAFMNPGGLRTDMLGNAGGFPRTLTFKQAADVQPFANTLVNMDLTGAQIKTVLEQQWQSAGASRPFLKLGISKGFTYTATPPPAGSPAGTRGTVTGMWLDGTPIGMGTVYSVTVNSFLAAGGDGFTELANGAGKQDTGQTDLQAMVAYMAAFGTSPDVVQPDYKQNGITIEFPADAPSSYDAGDHLKFDVTGWSMTNPVDVKDTDLLVKSGATTLATVPLDNTPQAALPGFDVTGKASVDFALPGNIPMGPLTLTLSGAATGSSFPLQITAGKSGSSLVAPDAAAEFGQPMPVQVTVTAGAGATPTGTVKLLDGATEVGAGTLGADGKVTITLPAKTLPAGVKTLTAAYSGDATHVAGSTTLKATTSKAASTTTAKVKPKQVKKGHKVKVKVSVVGANGVMATGDVTVTLKGKSVTVTLVNGEATVTLKKVKKGGKATVAYLGSNDVAASQTTVKVKVKKSKKK
jgi:5'-nucleotidase